MMTSLPSDSTQKTLSNDTHIIYFQKRQLLIMPSDASVIRRLVGVSADAIVGGSGIGLSGGIGDPGSGSLDI